MSKGEWDARRRSAPRTLRCAWDAGRCSYAGRLRRHGLPVALARKLRASKGPKTKTCVAKWLVRLGRGEIGRENRGGGGRCRAPTEPTSAHKRGGIATASTQWRSSGQTVMQQTAPARPASCVGKEASAPGHATSRRERLYHTPWATATNPAPWATAWHPPAHRGVRMVSLAASLTPLRISLKPISFTISP